LRSDGFHLVVSFSRSTFCLDLDHVCIAIQSCLGGYDNDLCITHIRDRVFKFSVVSKAVGFMINNLISYSCPSFICYFHLWGSGAPNWQREHTDWLHEQSLDWHNVSHRKTPLTGANVVPVAVGRSFADVVRVRSGDPISLDCMHNSCSPPISNSFRPTGLSSEGPTQPSRPPAEPVVADLG
jgi:hypothetical protein